MADASSRLRPRAAPKPAVSSAPRSRRQRERISYNEDDTDADSVEESVSQEDTAKPGPVARPRRTKAQTTGPARTNTRRSRKRKTAPTSRNSASAVAKKSKSSVILAAHEERRHEPREIQFSGRTMPWTTLPYYILASIFAYASHPVASDVGNLSLSAAWLLKMALVCKAFTEPALSALYYEPPLYTLRQLQSLSAMLENQSEQSALDYRSKVRSLSMIPINGLLKDPLRIENIIGLTPRLRGIALGVHSDDPKICRLYTETQSLPIDYSISFFDNLTNAQTKLDSWSWNRTLSSHQHLPLTYVKEVHMSSPFSQLRSLTFIDFHLPTKVDYCGNEVYGEEALADILSALPSLRKLRFSLADPVNERLMPLLPNGLQTLILTSCYNLFSPALEQFLTSKGQDIRELVLDHNQSLNLSFLIGLSRTCPKLEVLKMDLLYYNSHTTFKDSNPRYSSLLGDGEQPSWPASLRRIELLHLRRWKAPAAELFFSSLIEKAGSLPNLRYIEIKASIDESGWRERIAFRDKWVQRMEEVFLRRCTPPRTYLESFAVYRDWKAKEAVSNKAAGISELAQSNRGSALGLSVTQSINSINLSNNSDSDAPLIDTRRSARGRLRKEVVYNESDSENPPAKLGPRRNHLERPGMKKPSRDGPAIGNGDVEVLTPGKNGEEACVQGLCNVVDVAIDNLRPAEEQLHESDFLDEERSGDEDWDGDDPSDLWG